jgi:major membrane immunogen (membrane-anchored lipoprotein)
MEDDVCMTMEDGRWKMLTMEDDDDGRWKMMTMEDGR